MVRDDVLGGLRDRLFHADELRVELPSFEVDLLLTDVKLLVEFRFWTAGREQAAAAVK